MARPNNTEYRAAILGAFDTHLHRTLKEVNEYLKDTDNFISEQSTRRMLNKMVSEGLLIELGRRADKNAIIYTKAIFSNFSQFRTLNGDVVSLPDFVHHVNDLTWPVFSDHANEMLRDLILDALASSYPDPYLSKGTTPVAKEDVQRDLNALLNGLSKWHSFIKSFLDANVWSDFHRQQLAKEFRNHYAELHAAILDRKRNALSN